MQADTPVMRKTLLILCCLLIGCAAIPQRVNHITFIKVPSFEIIVTPEMQHRGYWIESSRRLVIEGRVLDGKIYLDPLVLAHEIEHMLHHLNPKFVHPHRKYK